MSQNKRPVRPGGMPQRSSAPSARPVTVQVRSVSTSGQKARATNIGQQRPASAGQPRPAGNAGQPRPAGNAGQPRPVQRPANSGAQRPAAPRASGSLRLPYDFAMLLGIGLVVIALGVVGQLLWPNGLSIGANEGAVEAVSAVSEIHGSGPIRINELMSSNDSTAVDENGVSADWIEVMNVSDREVNLSGYTLAKNERSTNVFTFPDHTLQAGECAVVFADSVLKQSAGETYHAPFRLSSQGGTLMLFNASGMAIDSVNFPAMTADMSYARKDAATWEISSTATCGMDNTMENYLALHQPRTDAGVEITEVVSSNTKTLADENGEYYDYFEIHNTTGAAIDLSGWFASDAVGRPTKWRLPEGLMIQPGEHKVIFCSGLDRASAEYPHTNFGLSSEGEAVVLSDGQGRVVSSVEFGLLDDDTAWQKSADGSWSAGTPTPGT